MKLLEPLFYVLFAGMVSGLVLPSCTPPHVDPPAGVDCEAACERMLPNNADHPHGLGCLTNGGKSPLGVECKVWLCETPMSPTRSACISHAASCEAADKCR